MSPKYRDLEKEKQLVEQAKQDPNAFGELYDMYFDEIFSFVAYKIGRTQDAEDVVASTFEKAMLNIHKYEWKGTSFASWLYRIAHNLVVDGFRSKKQGVSIEDLVGFVKDEQVQSVEDAVSQKLEVKKLFELIEVLPEDQKNIIYIRYIKEFSLQETVEITGKTVDSVKSLAKRALKFLRKEFEKNNSKKQLNDKYRG